MTIMIVVVLTNSVLFVHLSSSVYENSNDLCVTFGCRQVERRRLIRLMNKQHVSSVYTADFSTIDRRTKKPAVSIV